MMYGNFDDPNLNIAVDMYESAPVLGYKYHLDYHSISSNGTYFSKKTLPDIPIKWSEFIPGIDRKKILEEKPHSLFPEIYEFGSEDTRWQLIRGIFDCGYKQNRSPDFVGIISKSEFRLREVQRILWSLGIMSNIYYDPKNQEGEYLHANYPRKMHYILEIIGDKDMYPGFFYDIFKIEKMILNNENIMRNDIRFKQKISKITPMEHGYNIRHGFMYNVRLNKPGAMYLMENYMPRVSIM
jgi:hypothetical protein